MLTIDLNADLGEGCPWDAALLERVTSASICCGAHAGGDREILDTLRELKRQARGVVIGAHPGYPDRESFGRREREIDRDEVRTLVRQQVVHFTLVADCARAALERAQFIRAIPYRRLIQQELAEQRVKLVELAVAPVWGSEIILAF